MIKDAVSYVKGLKKRHLMGVSLFVIIFFVLFQMNYLKNTENTIKTADLANNQKRYLVVIGTEAKYVGRRSIIRSTYFNVHDNLVPVADFDHVEYAFLVHGGSPKSNTPERRAFETEKMEYNDIFMLPNDQTFNPGTAFHWVS